MVRRSVKNLPNLLAVLLLAGCGGNTGLGGLAGASGPVGYQSSNALSPNGFSETSLGPNQMRIRASGALENSRAELEKLAIARAADLGAQQHLKFFHVDAVNENIACGGKKIVGNNLNQVTVRHRRVVDVDVTFSKEAADPAWINSKESFPVLQSELAALAPQAGAKEASVQEGLQKCGS